MYVGFSAGGLYIGMFVDGLYIGLFVNGQSVDLSVCCLYIGLPIQHLFCLSKILQNLKSRCMVLLSLKN